MNEADLIRQVKNGNTEAFRYLVDNYRKLVVHIVGRIISQQDVLEDLCQDVFLKVFQKIGRFRGDSKFSTWIAAIAYNTSITYIKNKTNKGEIYLDDIVHAEKRWMTDDQIQINNKTEMTRILLALIEKLPIHYRTVLTLYHLEEFSYREIEQITGMPEGTVKSYLSRARSLLKQKIEKLQVIEKTTIFHEYAE